MRRAAEIETVETHQIVYSPNEYGQSGAVSQSYARTMSSGGLAAKSTSLTLVGPGAALSCWLGHPFNATELEPRGRTSNARTFCFERFGTVHAAVSTRLPQRHEARYSRSAARMISLFVA